MGNPVFDLLLNQVVNTPQTTANPNVTIYDAGLALGITVIAFALLIFFTPHRPD